MAKEPNKRVWRDTRIWEESSQSGNIIARIGQVNDKGLCEVEIYLVVGQERIIECVIAKPILMIIRNIY